MCFGGGFVNIFFLYPLIGEGHELLELAVTRRFQWCNQTELPSKRFLCNNLLRLYVIDYSDLIEVHPVYRVIGPQVSNLATKKYF